MLKQFDCFGVYYHSKANLTLCGRWRDSLRFDLIRVINREDTHFFLVNLAINHPIKNELIPVGGNFYGYVTFNFDFTENYRLNSIRLYTGEDYYFKSLLRYSI